MKKRQWLVLMGVLVVVLAALPIDWFYFSNPDVFPKKEQVVREMNDTFSNGAVKAIQDTIRVDDRHIVVPFISTENGYGLSYWAWENRKWKVLFMNSTGEPRLWKIHSKDPSTYTIVWNIHPDDQISNITFYLDRRRGYQVIDGVEEYSPKMLMEKQITIGKKSYGIMKLPREWAAVIASINNVESENQNVGLFGNPMPQNGLYFGWTPFNKSKKEIFPGHSSNGDPYGDGNIDLEFISILSGDEIE